MGALIALAFVAGFAAGVFATAAYFVRRYTRLVQRLIRERVAWRKMVREEIERRQLHPFSPN